MNTDMEENKELIEGILKRSSEIKAPDHLSASIMQAWKEEKAAPLVIPPLISTQAWALIVISFLGLILWILNSTQGMASSTPITDKMEQVTSLMRFDISLQPVALMSILAMGIMISINVLYFSGKRQTGQLFLF
jgi:hypothetical protein